jgi:hypothetical protein
MFMNPQANGSLTSGLLLKLLHMMHRISTWRSVRVILGLSVLLILTMWLSWLGGCCRYDVEELLEMVSSWKMMVARGLIRMSKCSHARLHYGGWYLSAWMTRSSSYKAMQVNHVKARSCASLQSLIGRSLSKFTHIILLPGDLPR